MANNTGVLLIYNAADRTDINRVGAALGRGPNNFTQKLTDADPAAWDSTVSGWYTFQSGSLDLMSLWSGLADTLPTLNDSGQPIVWDDFDLTEQSAAAALADLHVFACDTSTNLSDYISTVAGGVSFDKRVVPDPEF